MNRTLVSCVIICTSITLLKITTLLAGGLYISEFGTPSMGVASTGAQAVASDASTAFHNPAGMTSNRWQRTDAYRRRPIL
jgi:long-subunit fatty acid transport protein